MSDGWKIQSDQKSHFHVEGGETKIYWLQIQATRSIRHDGLGG